MNEAEVAAKKKKEEMEREIELVKKEYAEKMKKKKGKDKKDPKAEATEKDEKIAEGDDEQKAAEKEKDDKVIAKYCCFEIPQLTGLTLDQRNLWQRPSCGC